MILYIESHDVDDSCDYEFERLIHDFYMLIFLVSDAHMMI